MASLNAARPQCRQKNTLPDPQDQTKDEPPRIDSRVLLGECGRVVIDHRGERYTLSTTRAGKLILTK
ncbi:MAG: hemin uptake protein HemP [Wenzhouxiangellaceae bacterium]